MKTFKITIVLAGIIVAIITLLSGAVSAENLDKAEKNETSEKAIINQQELITMEQMLVGDYLESLKTPKEPNEETSIIVYDTEGMLVYKGEERKSKDMINKSVFLVQFGNEKIYTLF
jgi:hypothetical protein